MRAAGREQGTNNDQQQSQQSNDPDTSDDDDEDHGSERIFENDEDVGAAEALALGTGAASPSIHVGEVDDATASSALDDGKPQARPTPPSLSLTSNSIAAAPIASSSHPLTKASTVVKRRKPKPKHQRSQKPEGYPSRNRSSYNYFFQAQRALLIQEAKAPDGGPVHVSADATGAVVAQQEVGFENMAKTIAQRWKRLTPDELEPYQELARQDMARYRREMEEYQQELVRQSRLERERAAHGGGSASALSPAATSVSVGASLGPAAAESRSRAGNNNGNLEDLLFGSSSTMLQQNPVVPSSEILHRSPQDQATYANLVLSHLESLLQPQSQHGGGGIGVGLGGAGGLAHLPPPAQARAPAPNSSASMGDLNFLAASALSQMLVRQPPQPMQQPQPQWNPSSGSLSSTSSSSSALPSTATPMAGLLNLANLQLQLQQQQQQQQQQHQRQMESMAQLALLQQLLGAPLSGGGAAAAASAAGGSMVLPPNAASPDPGNGKKKDPPGTPPSSPPRPSRSP